MKYFKPLLLIAAGFFFWEWIKKRNAPAVPSKAEAMVNKLSSIPTIEAERKDTIGSSLGIDVLPYSLEEILPAEIKLPGVKRKIKTR